MRLETKRRVRAAQQLLETAALLLDEAGYDERQAGNSDLGMELDHLRDSVQAQADSDDWSNLK